MRLATSLLTAALILAISPAARADSFQYTINSSVTEYFSNLDNDNIMGIYSTPSDSWGTQSSVESGASNYGNSTFSDIAFSVPIGNTITSITMNLILPSYSVHGTADVSLSGGGRLPLHPPDTDNPVSIAPTLGPGTSSVLIDGLAPYGEGSYADEYLDGSSIVFNLSNLLMVNGSNISTNLGDVHLLIGDEIIAPIATQGYNYASYIGGDGQANIPYELEVSGTYSPVPEPSSIALLGTGILGLAGIARRKFLS